jgi:hypothetical protein
MVKDVPTLQEQFREQGVAIIEYALSCADLTEMARAFPASMGPGRRQSQLPPDLVAWLATHPSLLTLAERLLAEPARLTGVIAHEKCEATNWFVPWHQDRTITLAERRDAPGFERWTERAGQVQVEPPISILERTVALRIHLDDCPPDAGALEVLTRSHRSGRLDRAAIAALARASDRVVCAAAKGDIVAMSPLTVHRSQRARRPQRRRVLHLELVAEVIAYELDWAIV